MHKIYCILLTLFTFSLQAQQKVISFPKKCLGDWEGRMYIHAQNRVVDSFLLCLTVRQVDQKGRYRWRLESHSPRRPMVKDYQLVVVDEY